MKILFLGIGNRDRGDDAVGPVLADLLSKDPALSGVDILPHSGEGASLMHLWDEADAVFVVDAMKSGRAVGHVQYFDAARDPFPVGVFRYSSHLFGLAEAAEMARALGRLPRFFHVWGIEGADYRFGQSLSDPVRCVMPQVMCQIRAAIRERLDA